MTGKTPVSLREIEKTLLLPLMARAVESKRQGSVFTDRLAEDLADRLEVDFGQLDKNMAELSKVAWVSRSMQFDRLIRGFINRYPNGTVVNMGCGMDTTFERVDNGTIIWYDLDLPEVIDLRRKLLSEDRRRIFISGSFLGPQWYRLLQVEENILFTAAGLFSYYTEEQVKGFLIAIGNHFPGCEFLFDATSAVGVRAANHVLEKSGMDERARMKWALKDTRALLQWDRRFRLLGKYYTFRQKGLRLGLWNRFLGFLSDMLDIQYIVHLKVRHDYGAIRSIRTGPYLPY